MAVRGQAPGGCEAADIGQDGHIDLFISTTRRYHRFGSDTYSVLYIKISLFFCGCVGFCKSQTSNLVA